MKPTIQIDDQTREMTDEEYEQYLQDQQNTQNVGLQNDAK